MFGGRATGHFNRIWGRAGRAALLADQSGKVIARNPRAQQDFAAWDTHWAPLVGLSETEGRMLQDAALSQGWAAASAQGPQGCDVELQRHTVRSVVVLPGEALHDHRHRSHSSDAAGRALDASSLDQLPVAILMLDPGGTVLWGNARASDLLKDALRPGKPLSAHVESLGRPVDDWVRETKDGRGLARSEFLRIAGSDEHAFVQVRLGRVSRDEAAPLVAILDDAREIKSLEAQFIQAQKMQAIGQLAGGIAHDFNNLLTAISGHCDLLLLRSDTSKHDYDDLMQVRQNTNRAASLVKQLLAFSRKQTLRPAVIELEGGLSEMWHLLTRLVGEEITLSVLHDGAEAHIRVDQQQLEQVLMNLIVNARDAMPDGGTIQVRTSRCSFPQPQEVGGARIPAGDYAEIQVADTGTGIPAARLGQIFEPFFTTKPQGKGTGLGLSTAYGIVKQTGGFIFAESTVGQGTTFRILFPAVGEPITSAAPEATAASAQEPRLDRHGERGHVVLIVEDEAPVRACSARVLRLKGYHVLEAESGEAALEIVKGYDGPIDAFVSDVIMPGLDGPAWVAEARAHFPDVGVIFMSGYARDAFADRGREVATAKFLAKPFSLSDLVEAVRDVVD
ncbi:MAG: ATP-binding protein [Shimia sp.]